MCCLAGSMDVSSLYIYAFIYVFNICMICERLCDGLVCFDDSLHVIAMWLLSTCIIYIFAFGFDSCAYVCPGERCAKRLLRIQIKFSCSFAGNTFPIR
jgi:hypothetical protein